MHQAPICENRCCYFLKVGEVWQIWEFRDKEDLQKKLPVICKVKVTHYPFKNFHFEYNYESKFASMILTIVMILKFSSMVTFGWFTQKFSKERLLFMLINLFFYVNNIRNPFLCTHKKTGTTSSMKFSEKMLRFRVKIQ